MSSKSKRDSRKEMNKLFYVFFLPNTDTYLVRRTSRMGRGLRWSLRDAYAKYKNVSLFWSCCFWVSAPSRSLTSFANIAIYERWPPQVYSTRSQARLFGMQWIETRLRGEEDVISHLKRLLIQTDSGTKKTLYEMNSFRMCNSGDSSGGWMPMDTFYC